MTGSQPILATRSLVQKLLLVAAIAAVVFAGQALLRSTLVGAGGGDKFTVNTISDGADSTVGDGICEVTASAGDCTLRAAIEESNFDTDHDTINFLASLFTQSSPATIKVGTALPTIYEDLTITAVERGVIIDGSNLGGAEHGLTVDAAAGPPGTIQDFLVFGGGSTLEITGFPGDGINIDGDGGDLNEITIDGVDINGVLDDGIEIHDFANVGSSTVTITNNDIDATAGGAPGDGVNIEQDGSDLDDNTVLVSGNTISASGEAVDIEFNGDMGTGDVLNINVDDNVALVSTGDDAVDVEYCADGSGCDAPNADINISVSRNGSLEGGDEGVDVSVDADDESDELSTNTDVTINIDDNGPITASADAVRVDVDICCGTSDSDSTVSVDGNGDITGAFSGVDVTNFVCCGDSNEGDVSVSGNGAIDGASGDGVNVRNEIGDPFGEDAVTSDGNMATTRVNDNASITGSDDGVEIDENFAGDDDGAFGLEPSNNTSTVEVNGNGKITATGDNGVRIIGTAGTGGGSRDAGTDNISTITVDGNGPIVADDRGIDIVGTAGKAGGGGDSNDGNSSTVTVTNNGNVTGATDDAMEIKTRAGKAGGPGSADSGDNNDSTLIVSGNGDITSSGGKGLDLESAAGKKGDGNSSAGGTNNTSTITVDDNGDITGTSDGIETDNSACCTDDNTTDTSITNNGKIDGGSDGVDVDNMAGHDDDNASTVDVSNNEDISGDFDGVDIDSEAGQDDSNGVRNSSEVTVDGNGDITGDSGDGVTIDSEVDADDAVLDDSDNSSSITVTGNGEITGSDDGVDAGSFVCCDPANTNTINVSDNLSHITGTGGDGIDIAGSFSSPGDYLCCSANTINIEDNGGTIKGGDNGIEISACGDAVTDSLDTDCLGDSTTILVIDGNDISDSGSDGIIICCGDFGDPAGSKGVDRSVIRDNTISSNLTGGVHIDNASGIQIGPNNVITLNGDASGIDIEEHDFTAMTPGPEADGNTITQNSIFDNESLGIDLDGDGVVNCSGLATSDPNNCLKEPTLLLIDGTTLSGVGCAGCLLEIFVADNLPADNDDHGEGSQYLISTIVDGLGAWSVKLCETPGGLLTATQTNELGDTSEFGENFAYGGTDKPCATPTPEDTVTPTPMDTPTDTPTPEPDTGSIQVCKDTNPESSGKSFDFDTDIPGMTDPDLEDDECDIEEGVDPDTYEITENPPTGWTLDDIDCDGTSSSNIDVDLDTDTVTIDLDAGDDVICTFTNVDADPETSSVTVCKETDPEGAAKAFEFETDLPDIGDFELEDGECEDDIALPAGEYAISEVDQEGLWNLTEIDCTGTDELNLDIDLDTLTVVVDLQEGEDVECTFTNEEKVATVTATATATTTPTPTDTPSPTDTPVPPTETPTNTPVIPATPGNTIGDVNKNGVVNAIDAQLILQAEAGFITLANPKNADVNLDGEVNSVDASLIQQFVAGLIQSLPV